MEFYVYDDKSTNRCCTSLTEPVGEQNFKIENPKCKTIRVLAVDHCFLFDADGENCDAILYDNNHFCFVELKKITSKNPDTRKIRKRKARSQLMATIDLFSLPVGPTILANYQLEAYSCVGDTPTQPAILSQNQAAKRDFAKKQVQLFDGCEKQF